jgi:hypothetical protein
MESLRVNADVVVGRLRLDVLIKELEDFPCAGRQGIRRGGQRDIRPTLFVTY